MKKLILSLSILLAAGVQMYSQEEYSEPSQKWLKYIHIETGFMYPAGNIKENIAIRQNLSSYFVNQYSEGEIMSETSGINFGVKYEYFSPRFKTGIATGLRYTGYLTDISGYSSGNAEFFYLRYSTLGSDTKFARVKSLSERHNFVTIPIELRMVPVKIKDIGFFVKAGAEFTLLNFKNDTNIEFQDPAMNASEDNILFQISDQENTYYSTLYGSVGMEYALKSKTSLTFEVFLPSFVLSDNIFDLTDVSHIEGFKFSVLIPLN